jgi:hypothetical protein
MISPRNPAISVFGAVMTAAPTYSQDLSRYREFQLGTNLPMVAKQIRVKPSEAKAIHERPAVIQELEWRNPLTDSSQRSDSVGNILFRFYNGELYRLVVTYDRERTEGMTAEDIVEAVSAKYGTANRLTAEIILSSTRLFTDGEKLISDRSEKVIARWEDSQYSFNLFQYSSEATFGEATFGEATFGLVVYSKWLDDLAQAAIVESVRMDKQEAPQRKIESRKKKDDANRAKQEKARRVNKPPFRP